MDTWKPTRAQISAAVGSKVPDVIAAELTILFVGINPSLYSAAVGHHFARPGNRFWPALHKAGITPRLFSPFEGQSLVAHGCGITNFVARATARADELSANELRDGARRLRQKVRRRRIDCVAVLGVTAYRAAFAEPKATIGRQQQQIGDSLLWVLPNPSGLNAHYQLGDFAKLFQEMKQELDEVG